MKTTYSAGSVVWHKQAFTDPRRTTSSNGSLKKLESWMGKEISAYLETLHPSNVKLSWFAGHGVLHSQKNVWRQN